MKKHGIWSDFLEIMTLMKNMVSAAFLGSSTSNTRGVAFGEFRNRAISISAACAAYAGGVFQKIFIYRVLFFGYRAY